MEYTHFYTNLGPVFATSTAAGILQIKIPSYSPEEELARTARRLQAQDIRFGGELLDRLQTSLLRYFAGEPVDWDLPLDLHGTPFQLRVWNAVRGIPHGETRSYSYLARTLGKPGLTRAVGVANGLNPIQVLVPCHRVVGANGSLVGYSGGLDLKRRLLELERSRLPLLS